MFRVAVNRVASYCSHEELGMPTSGFQVDPGEKVGSTFLI